MSTQRRPRSTKRRCAEYGHLWDDSDNESTVAHFRKHTGEGDERAFTQQIVDPATNEPYADSGYDVVEAPKRQSGATILLSIFAEAEGKLIRDQYGEPYATLPGGRVLPLTGGGIGNALVSLYLQREEGEAPPKNAASEAIDVLRARALNEGKVEPVYLRFGPLADKSGIAIDLGTNDYDAIVIRPGRVKIEKHPVHFRRLPALMPLPLPNLDAKPAELTGLLRKLLNVPDDDAAQLVATFLLSILKPEGPFLGVAFTGPEGTAKTFAARLLRALIDPQTRDGGGGVRSLPRDADSFTAVVRSNAVPVFDNLSGATAEQSDWLAQVMTGYSSERRKLYTDDESFQRAAKRPVILTGIEVTDRSDLLSRLLLIELAPLASFSTEESLWRKFDEVHPYLLGALCNAVAAAYKFLDLMPVDGWTVRMADVVRFVTAAEPALGWEKGWTQRAVREAQGASLETVLSEQTWYPPLVAFMEQSGGTWHGEPTALLEGMRVRYADEHGGMEPRTADTSWPRNAKALSAAMTRHGTALKQVGIVVDRRRSGRRREVYVSSTSRSEGPGV